MKRMEKYNEAFFFFFLDFQKLEKREKDKELHCVIIFSKVKNVQCID